jgi:putative holliday junction resolvase
MGRLLGLDYGRKRIGVALSDSLKMTAQPFETWPGKSWEGIIERLSACIIEYEVEAVIVGLPLLLTGESGSMAREVHRFCRNIEKYVSVPVYFIDERLTSVQSRRVMREMGIKKCKRKGKTDQISAQIILQLYLDIINKTTEEG